MLKYQEIDRTFRALAEPTRRAIVERLAQAPATVGEVAKPFDMSLAAVVQHIQVLEEAGLIRTQKVGRSRLCRIDVRGMETLGGWLAARRQVMERRLDRLGDLLAESGPSESKEEGS